MFHNQEIRISEHGNGHFSFIFDFRIGADDDKCIQAISTYKLAESNLLDQCELLHSHRNKSTVNIYRRLLPAKYVDGLSKVSTMHSI